MLPYEKHTHKIGAVCQQMIGKRDSFIALLPLIQYKVPLRVLLQGPFSGGLGWSKMPGPLHSNRG